MNDDNDNDTPDLDPNVISFADFQASGGGKRKFGEGTNNGRKPTVAQSEPLVRERTFQIITVDGDVTVKGLLALTSEFLAVGDGETGVPRFVVANGNWQYVKDITDIKKPSPRKK